MTLGPIESALQPGRGYGSKAFEETLDELVRMHVNWVSLTVFGRVWDLKSSGVEPSFEAPQSEARANLRQAIFQAKRRGLKVFLVPHLWVESRAWRAEMNPGSDAAWERWQESYQNFVVGWAQLAEEEGVDLFAAGVELRSWVTAGRASSFRKVLRAIRGVYRGSVTYAANWDDVDDTLILDELDVIGINAFYQLHWEDDASFTQLLAGGQRVAEQVLALKTRYHRPIIFTEFGYTARKNTAIRPWLWPEELGELSIDQVAQSEAYAALLSALPKLTGFYGTFTWRMYADISDLSQEPDWGFSPWGKKAATVLSDAYQSRSAMDQYR